MNLRPSTDDLATMQFGIGQPVKRQEDPILVRGEGRYTDDVSLPGQLFAAFVRSPYAHGLIKAIDTDTAKAMPGVVAVYTGADLAPMNYGPLKCVMGFSNRDGSPMTKPLRKALATDKVRFVGDPVAVVIAQTAHQARDAVEAVECGIDVLPAVTRVEDAIKPGAPQIYDEAPGNLILDYHYGDSDKVADAFAKAAHVARLAIRNNRIVVNAMEPRAALASHDRASERFTLYAPSQGVFGKRNNLAEVMGVPQDKMRLITGHVGGSFGMKGSVFPEYVCLMHAARELDRPVKWTDQRSDSFTSDHHGRDMEVVAELALDKDGRFLATRFTGYGNMGAYLTAVGPMMTTLNIAKNSIGMYRTPLVEVNTICAVTNTVPIGAYRGAGRPEGNYYMERLIETAAAEMSIDAVELRRRNMVTPDLLPWATPAGTSYDSGDFPGLLDRALEAADWDGFEARREESRALGHLRGRGIGCYLEVTAPPSNEMGGIHFEADGTVTIVTGTLDYGQGHWSPFAQVLHEKLGVPFDKDPPRAGRQRPSDRRRRYWGLQVDHGERRGDRRGERRRDREGQTDRRACAGGRSCGHRVRQGALHDCRHGPPSRRDGAGANAPRRLAAAARHPADRSASTTSSSWRRRPTRTGATSQRWRSTLRPASPRSSAMSWSTTSARS